MIEPDFNQTKKIFDLLMKGVGCEVNKNSLTSDQIEQLYKIVEAVFIKNKRED